jgi:hypothetical protein
VEYSWLRTFHGCACEVINSTLSGSENRLIRCTENPLHTIHSDGRPHIAVRMRTDDQVAREAGQTVHIMTMHNPKRTKHSGCTQSGMTSLQAMSRNQSDEANEALAMRFECTGERYCPLFHAIWSNIKLGLEHFFASQAYHAGAERRNGCTVIEQRNFGEQDQNISSDDCERSGLISSVFFPKPL